MQGSEIAYITFERISVCVPSIAILAEEAVTIRTVEKSTVFLVTTANPEKQMARSSHKTQSYKSSRVRNFHRRYAASAVHLTLNLSKTPKMKCRDGFSLHGGFGRHSRQQSLYSGNWQLLLPRHFGFHSEVRRKVSVSWPSIYLLCPVC